MSVRQISHFTIVRRYDVASHLYLRRWASKSYKQTLNLPKTKFKPTMKDGAVAQKEVKIQESCGFSELYSWQREEPQREKEFVLHDGPPYANGATHVGHALNKILKDVTNRYKLLQGYKVHYVPGWDCHGMPIEQKALAEAKADYKTMSPLEIRKKAKIFAQKTIQKHKAVFQRWGVMADWEQSCYFTFDKEYESNELEIFFQMYEKGLIYQDYMPVHWSPSSGSALAEAELEYNKQHKSTAVYVMFPINRLPDEILKKFTGGPNVSAVIWTTTPWTLPANQAICYGPTMNYSLVQRARTNKIYLVSTEFVEEMAGLLRCKLKTLYNFKGENLEGTTYVHPLFNKEMPLLPANHVSSAKGTGLVHTAPAHGVEDFQAALRHKLSVKQCMVDEDGLFTHQAGPQLVGQSVLGEGNNTVMDLLKDFILHQSEYEHSYPYDWRTKQPVIMKASKQWFVNTSKIKDKALAALEDMPIYPRSSENGMLSQLEARTYWCISRQRVWGVPIPVFYEKATGKPLLTRTSVNHLKTLVQHHGTDCWWTLPLDQLLPKQVVEESGFNPSSEFEQGQDILDIWFDSGVSWSAAMKGACSELYLEGLDQFGGWFQSSLLTSTSVQDKAPYKSLVVHGFVVDEEGRKMSKSLGNVVNPDLVINGGKDKEKEPAYGADVLRWWAALANLDGRVNIGPSVLHSCQEQVFKVRKCLGYLLGNLYDFDVSQHQVAYQHLLPQDKYMLHLLHGFCEQVTTSYEEFRYDHVLLSIEKFINAQVSSFHSHMSKDRMYCGHAKSSMRRSGQTVQYLILDVLMKALAPVLPHLAEELHMHHPFPQEHGSIFKTPWFAAEPEWHNPELEQTFQVAFGVRDAFFKVISSYNPVDFDVVISTKGRVFEELKKLQEELTSSGSPLCEVLCCSSVSVLARPPLVIPDEAQPADGICQLKQPDGTVKDGRFLLVILPAENFLCERCRRYTAVKNDELCNRCSDVVAQGWDS